MSDQTKPKICFLSLSKLTPLAETVFSELPSSDAEYVLLNCPLEAQEERVREALELGCEVFIAGPGNSAVFQTRYELPLVEINISSIDFAMAIRRALDDGASRIAVVRHRYSPPLNILMLQSLMQCPLQELVYEGSELLELIRASGCDAVVGSAMAMDMAEAAGKPGVLVYMGTEGIRDACLRAAELARELRESRKNRAITKTVMNNTQLGIIVTDTDGRIQFFNHTAQTYTGFSPSQARERTIGELFPHLSVAPLLKSRQRKSESFRLIDGAMMRCVQEKILLRNETVGVLTTLYPGAHNRRERQGEAANINTHIYHWEELTVRSEAMKRLVARGQAHASRRQPTVILGEPGSGREEIAYCIHGGSDRANYPCLTLDLATIPEQDAPHILFGYERGERTVDGMLANANGGSVVLKNLSKAKPAALACLQQVLNGRPIFRPGMEAAFSPDLVFYTVTDREELQKLPPDLRSQLSIHFLEMPPLRERPEDIGPLFLKYLTQLTDVPNHFSLSPQMEALLRQYRWPGNVWELRAVSQRYVLARGELEKPSAKTRYLLLLQAIGEEAFFADLLAQYPVLKARPVTDREAFREAVEAAKTWTLMSNDALAARLDLSRTTLWRLLRESR